MCYGFMDVILLHSVRQYVSATRMFIKHFIIQQMHLYIIRRYN